MSATTDRVRKHRKRLRALGLRPVQLWVPDVRTAGFVADAARQSQAVARSRQAREDQDFVDAIAEPWTLD